MKIGVKNVFESSKIDPIEAVSSLCAIEGIKIDIVDNYGRTPLSYASQRGSTVSALYLLERGAVLDHQDKEGNTPLGISLLNHHSDYALMLLQKGSNVNKEINVYSHDWNKKTKMFDSSFLVKYSTFRAAITNEYQGITYTLLDKGFNYQVAMQDAISVAKFNLVETLLRKTNDNNLVRGSNEERQNLFHLLALGSSNDGSWHSRIANKLLERGVEVHAKDKYGCSPFFYAVKCGHTTLCQFFIRCGAKVDESNNEGITPFVACINGRKIFVANRNIKKGNKSGFAGFAIAQSLPALLYTDSGDKYLEIAKMLLINKVSVNVVYKESSYYSIVHEKDSERVRAKKEHDNEYKTTPLIEAIKLKDSICIDLLLHYNADVNLCDSDGRSPIMHCVLSNRITLVNQILAKSPNLSLQDKQGKSVIHLAINPLEFGSYENSDLLVLLAKKGAPLKLADKKGKSQKFLHSFYIEIYYYFFFL